MPEFHSALASRYGIRPSTALMPHMLRLSSVEEEILVDLDIDTRPVYMGRVGMVQFWTEIG